MLLPLPLLALTFGLFDGAAAQGSVTDYAPTTNVKCPAAPLVRVFTPQNQSLHPQEQAYISTRESTILPDAWKEWIGDGSGIGYNASVVQAMQGNWSRIGIAISGGGFRAAQYGAGVLSGLDARNESAKAAGTGGLLQVASYLSGLSGGSWITGSLYMNNWLTIKDMVFGNGGNLSGWLLDLNLAAPAGIDLFNQDNQYFFGSLVWSTTRSNFFTNDSAHGAGQLWSQIPETPAFQQYIPPFPIVMSDSRPVGSNLTTALTPEPVVYEMTPLEFGSWDPNLSAMVNMSFAGTHFVNGTPPNDTACVTGFDQAGFIMGSSASLFNQILDFGTNTLTGFSSQDASGLLYVLSRQLQEVRTRANDVANWPNPFQGLKSQTFEDSSSDWLELIDGSSNAENVPLGQLFVRARGLDVIVAVDSSADQSTTLWPNGSSIVASSNRMSTILLASHQKFPPIPQTPADFISTGVNRRPTFFGCNPTQNPPEYPMVIYFPNSPPLNGENPVTNTGTFQIAYTPIHTRIFIDQVHNNTIGGFLPNTTSPDPNFGKCLQCAAVDRARYKLSPMPPRSDVCSQCFAQYCFDPWNPPSQNELPGRQFAFVDPDPQGVSGALSFFAKNKAALIGGFVGLFVAIALLVTFLIWWKKRKHREAEYSVVKDLHDDDDAALLASVGLDKYELKPRRRGFFKGGDRSAFSFGF
ncbi:hypothetical protein GLOTRDRAFT_73425 [Gloeophyllum trabeum ATCC 11539]|uniref:Lysophospholipase n=1 Tax=Gloeophyllum trabeum (strain ATCC 11539 / FP-39264 / Madison 617) TaxID=670483 RepID=S7RUS6_GLOTA|nr:uncharacterized protein GLOTRDRAFT_73425 [Gloeophyllum trabeum ATCC 11539]EPQ56964.1 hypothetical protein GLOTRDRAFT_73425 [Gloeophyllum trabeum ATCC 11539]